MFQVPEEVKKEIGQYKDQLDQFLRGQLSEDQFKPIRVSWGIYSQRKHNGYMLRVRFPGGVMSPEQLKVLAKISKEYSQGSLHVTTRQDIQIHHLKDVAGTGRILDCLKQFELSSRGGGGNTLRNITTCSRAGLCPYEVVDVRSFAIGLSEYVLAKQDSYHLPRKYKIAFSGCSRNCALATVTDLGFVAKKEEGKNGYFFSVYAGGGLGARSAVGKLLELSCLPSEVGYIAEAVKRVFNQYGDRQDRHRARLRFLVEKIGFSQFEELYRKELWKVKQEESIVLRDIRFPQPISTNETIPEVEDEAFSVWKKYNLREQFQKGNFMMEIRLDLGDIQAEQMDSLADLCFEWKGLQVRALRNQNLLLFNVPAKNVYPVFKRFLALGLAKPYASTAADVICCVGATTCNLGLCNSKGAASAISKCLEEASLRLDVLQDVQIKINGCPNACAQHPTAPLGFHGMSRKVGARLVPFYRVLAGGRIEEGKTQLAKEMGAIPAKNLPYLVRDFLLEVQNHLTPDFHFWNYLESRGEVVLKSLIEKYANVPSYEQDPSFYRDWGKQEDFSLAELGQGECGAA